MWRNVGSVLLGLIVGGIVNGALIGVNGALYPPPPGTDTGDPTQLAAYVATLPATALLVVIVAHLLQAGIGGWIAARLGTAPMALALIVGALSALAGVANLVMLGAPAWMWIEVPLYFVVAGGAGRLEARRRAGPAAAASAASR